MSNKKEKGGMKNYFKGVRAEMKKVIWPSKKELANYTGVVVLVSLIIAIIIYLLDFLIHSVLSLFL